LVGGLKVITVGGGRVVIVPVPCTDVGPIGKVTGRAKYKTLEQSPQNVDSERTKIGVPRTELCTFGEWCEYGIVYVYGLTPQNVDSERTEEGARVERDLCVAGHVSPPSGVVINRL